MKKNKNLITGMLVSTALTFGASAEGENTINGHWVTEGGNVIVDIHACDTVTNKVCADVVWADDAAPDQNLNDQPILSNFEYGKGMWRGGRLWDAAAKRAYHARIKMQKDGSLSVDACALGKCYEQTWVRPDARTASLKGYFAALKK